MLSRDEMRDEGKVQAPSQVLQGPMHLDYLLGNRFRVERHRLPNWKVI